MGKHVEPWPSNFSAFSYIETFILLVVVAFFTPEGQLEEITSKLLPAM